MTQQDSRFKEGVKMILDLSKTFDTPLWVGVNT